LSQGKLSEADQALQRSLELYRKLDDDWGQGHSLNDLGEVAIDKGNFEQAFTNFDSARRLFEKLNHRDGLTAVMVNRGRALLDQGQSSQALPLLSKALRLALERTKRSGYMLGPIYLLIARASLELGELDRARTVANDALKMVETAGNQEYMAQAQATLAQIHAAQGDPATAQTMYEQALTLFEQVGSRIRLIRTKQSYADFLAKQGHKNKAASLKTAARDEAAKIGLYLG
jgi:tetratricopeptide (TPR) repeat protein